MQGNQVRKKDFKKEVMGIILAQTTNNKIPLKRAKDWGITRLRNMEAQLKPQGISNKESFVSTNRRQNTNEKKMKKSNQKAKRA